MSFQDHGQVVPDNVPPADDFDGRARRMGWKPKEEFRGDPDRWTDAKTFVERGENELPVLRERYRTLDDRMSRVQSEFESTRREIQDLKKTNQEAADVLLEMRERSRKAEEIGYSRARREAEEQMARAVEQADANGYNRAKIELDRILEAERASMQSREPPKPITPASPAPPQNQAIDPEITQWVSENQWFNVDQGMAGFATAMFHNVRQARPGLSTRAQLDEVRREVLKRFPEKFDNPRRQDPSSVTTTTNPNPSPSRKGPPPFEQWPADAKAAFEKFKRQMPDYKAEEYAKLYFAGEE